MMSTLKFLLGQQLKHQKLAQKTSGFTLLELLVAMIISSIVLGSLLSFMVNILDTDRREQAKSNSEQEVQTALDYISRDLQQAVYVYDASGIDSIKTQLPPQTGVGGCQTTATCTPVLVFWKREFKSQVIPVSTSFDDSYVFSLVAYYLVKDNSATWSKAARVSRFQIVDSVSSDGVVRQQASNGFRLFSLDQPGTLSEKMNSWRKGTAAYSVSADTLVDFIDQSPSATNDATRPISCTNVSPNAQLVPSASFDSLSMSGFYACVDRNATLAKVYLRGNAMARINGNPVYNPSRANFFPTASVRVQGRGFLTGQ